MNKRNSIEKAIIKTLCYSDVFDYPLRKSQLWQYLIEKKICEKDFFSELKLITREKKIGEKNDYYFLLGRQKLTKLRKERKKESLKKNSKAKKIAKILSIIPTVKLIGVSGSLAMENSRKEDDIDLFIITRAKSLWITRLLVNLILILMGEKRNRNDRIGMNRICPNMFLTEDSIRTDRSDRNLFIAHEIVQLKVLVNRSKMHERFLASNSWILQFLPSSKIPGNSMNRVESNVPLEIIDKLLYSIQERYMRKRITSEKIGQNLAKFHPNDKSNFILQIYKWRLKNWGKSIGQSKKSRFNFRSLILQDIDI